MEIIFIRHGQGIHNTDIPDRLNFENPRLTNKGREQAALLKSTFSFQHNDVFITSPTIRTIETTAIMTSGLLHARKYISPLVGPRMFPLPASPEASALRCDRVYPLTLIRSEHTDFIITDQEDEDLWKNGINIMSEEAFRIVGQRFLQWIQTLNANKVYVIAHDGTITSYRILLGETGLSRSDFLPETGWHRIEWHAKEQS
ncbi:Phosphoglycerate mutase [Paenibacillus curdlanolyticus YK9]|uniref:Phosphoglycerate mutase n=1 Tax=Paenibacillus curdlanolyticus YK9 TaxID=717606 RepID=E0I894_9BACL|nr:histidine phosphatase family protein [Paenibacillus curdlanolyticus]EFM11399.1 Phosphoglycerate mutase [Paenibacillus curdlanolyticus YK9]